MVLCLGRFASKFLWVKFLPGQKAKDGRPLVSCSWELKVTSARDRFPPVARSRPFHLSGRGFPLSLSGESSCTMTDSHAIDCRYLLRSSCQLIAPSPLKHLGHQSLCVLVSSMANLYPPRFTATVGGRGCFRVVICSSFLAESSLTQTLRIPVQVRCLF